MNLKTLAGLSRDFGETLYMVDSDFRTIAQGWSRADRTGPLDLYLERNVGRVFRTGDYATDAAAIQAAIDEMIDFRGDLLFFTPGAYTVVTARTLDVPDARWLGPPVSHPMQARATLTQTLAGNGALALGAAADRMEFGYLRFVPITAQTFLTTANATDGLHIHDIFYDADGIAASTATIFLETTATPRNMLLEGFYIFCDAAQGPLVNHLGAVNGFTFRDFQIFQEAGTWAAVIDFEGAGVVMWDIGPGSISGTGGAAITSLVTQADKTQATSHGKVWGVRASTVGPAAGSLAVAAGVAAEVDILDCWRAVATDTIPPAHNAVSTDTQCGTPYTG